MAKQTINIGTTANDRTGDHLRSAMTKINSNFTELYDADTTAGSYTLTAFNRANAAFTQANTGTSLANTAYNQANTGTTLAQAAFTQANTMISLSSLKSVTANSSSFADFQTRIAAL